jgi:Fe-S cluster assembly protein SufD
LANAAPARAKRSPLDGLTQRISACGGPEWAQRARRDAWEVFRETTWPTRTDEGWRRTDIGGIPFEEILATWDPSYRTGPSSRDSTAHGGAVLHERNAPKLAGPGETTAALTAKAAEKGVVLMDLAEALEHHRDLLEERFARPVGDSIDRRFVALSRALWTAGLFVYVPEGVEADLPFHVQAVFGGGRLMVPRLLLIAEAGSKVTLLDEHVSPAYPEQMLSVGVADLFLGDGAKVHYALLNRLGDNVSFFHHIRSEVGRDASLTTLTLALGSTLTKATNETVLMGRGANSDMLGLVFGGTKQRFEHHTTQHHTAPSTVSDLLVKVAVTDEARSVYSGMIRIEPEAQQANAYQRNQNILLSKTAHADTIPNLEILANDVRCTHGATVAPLDEEQVFYMKARGIAETEAKRLIVQGFLDQVLDRAGLGGLDAYVRVQARKVIAQGLRGGA